MCISDSEYSDDEYDSERTITENEAESMDSLELLAIDTPYLTPRKRLKLSKKKNQGILLNKSVIKLHAL